MEEYDTKKYYCKCWTLGGEKKTNFWWWPEREENCLYLNTKIKVKTINIFNKMDTAKIVM